MKPIIRYRINKAERLLTVRFSGAVSAADWQKALSQAIAECPEVVTFDSVNDIQSPKAILTGNEASEFAVSAKTIGMQDHPRRSVVIARQMAHFVISQMFENMTQPDREVDRLTTDSISKAAAWVGRPEALVRAELDALDAPKGA